MFGRITPQAVRHPYRDLVEPGVRCVAHDRRSIDPVQRAGQLDARSPTSCRTVRRDVRELRHVRRPARPGGSVRRSRPVARTRCSRGESGGTSRVLAARRRSGCADPPAQLADVLPADQDPPSSMSTIRSSSRVSVVLPCALATGPASPLDPWRRWAGRAARVLHRRRRLRRPRRAGLLRGGRVVVGVTSTPFKCPPAPSETALCCTIPPRSATALRGASRCRGDAARRHRLSALAERSIAWHFRRNARGASISVTRTVRSTAGPARVAISPLDGDVRPVPSPRRARTSLPAIACAARPVTCVGDGGSAGRPRRRKPIRTMSSETGTGSERHSTSRRVPSGTGLLTIAGTPVRRGSPTTARESATSSSVTTGSPVSR